MKKEKAVNWQKLSEGILTASEITTLEKFRQPIIMTLLSVTSTGNGATGTLTGNIQIVPVRGPRYNVINFLGGTGTCINPKPYTYLSCAVRRAVKEYKTALRSGKWRILTK